MTNRIRRYCSSGLASQGGTELGTAQPRLVWSISPPLRVTDGDVWPIAVMIPRVGDQVWGHWLVIGQSGSLETGQLSSYILSHRVWGRVAFCWVYASFSSDKELKE